MAPSLPIEYDYPLIAIGIDPGGTTGISVFKFLEDSVEFMESYQLGDPDYVWKSIHSIAHYWQAGYRVVLVIEQFDKRPGIVNPDFTPKFINRDIQNNIDDVEMVFQIPAAAMNLVKTAKRNGTGDQLKRFGWYSTNNVHANDATRHVIVFAVDKLHHMPTILRGWPKPKDD